MYNLKEYTFYFGHLSNDQMRTFIDGYIDGKINVAGGKDKTNG